MQTEISSKTMKVNESGSDNASQRIIKAAQPKLYRK